MNKIRWSLFVVSVMFISIGLITRFTVGAKETLVNEDTQTNPVFYQDIQVVENPDSLSVLVNKNYSLPEDYKPQDLVLLDVPLYNEDVTNEGNYQEKAASALKSLFLAAQEEGHKLVARSGYRSYETQVSLINDMLKKMGQRLRIPIVQDLGIVNIRQALRLILLQILFRVV